MPLSGLFPYVTWTVGFLIPLKMMIILMLILPSLVTMENCICVMILSEGLV